MDSPMADLNRRLLREANYLDDAHRWAVASMAGIAASVVFAISAVGLDEGRLFYGAAVAFIAHLAADWRRGWLVDRAKALRELREGRLH